MNTTKHIWQFSRIGGVNRVNIETGNDLLALEQLDQKLWTALSCPVTGLEIDPNTLKLIDSDNDGKIRVPEILEAVKWITTVVKDANCLINPENAMPLSTINTNTELGEILLASSKQILTNIGKPNAESITVEETADTVAIFANTIFNGDGIITAESTSNEEIKTLISQIISCEGSVTDRSGIEGINAEITEAFFNDCAEFVAWQALSVTDAATILPFAAKTEDAFAVYNSIKLKVEDYFLRCQLADFDNLTTETLNAITARLEAINTQMLPNCIDEIANFPLSKIEAQKSLSLLNGVNPAWKEQLLKFKELVFNKASKSEITEGEWKQLSQKFEAYENWKSQKKGEKVESLGLELIQNIIAENKKEEILGLISEDLKLETEANNIILVEKMVRYYRDVFKLLKNFVTFSDFYSPNKQAIFQAGSLFFDQRSCELCIKVSDMGKHNAMAASSGICLVYFDCTSRVKNEKMTIVAAFTDGDVDNLEVGRNAIFYDRNGLDWDATIIKIIDNPISIRQAFWSPYRKFSKFISKQVEKFAASKDQQVQGSATANFEKASTQVAASGEVPKPAPFDIAKFAGIFAAIGLAFGAIGGVLATAAKGFFALTWWKMPLAILGIMLIISGPSMILAWLKLRKRNLAPVLDANGWAINAKATINIAFGATLTHLAKLPKNSKLNYIDPFKKKSNPWLTALIIIVIIAIALFIFWKFGLVNKWSIYESNLKLN